MKCEKKQIKDICEFIGGSQPPKSEFIHEKKEGYVRLIQIRDRLNDKFITYIPEKSTTKFCEPDDILIGRYGPPIFQIFRGFKGAYNVALMKANPLNGVNKDFLYYFLLQDGILKYVESMSARTAGQTGVELDSLYEYPVRLPDTTGQGRIVNVLKTIDDKIHNNNKINAELELMARTIYNYWFLQFDFPDENGKPYKSSGGKMVWNEKLKREIPDGWNCTTIGDITNCYDSSRIPLSNAEREKKKGNIPYYGATGIMDYVDEAIFDGDYVLMAEDGSVMDEKGNPILQRITGRVWVNNHAHVLKPSKSHGCKLLMMLLKDVAVMKIKTGSIQMKINQENMNKIIVPEIPENLINRINLILDDIDSQILHREQEIHELASLRDFLLTLLMNGQVGFKE